MKDFSGKIAVVTGGGSGMGRALVRQLVSEGCHVALCDVSQAAMEETIALARADGDQQGVRITAHRVDVSDEEQFLAFRDAIVEQHRTDHINLLFNNAGIGLGGGSMIADGRAEWERMFNICWGGVYLGVRTFLPLLQAADEGHIVNTSSVNGLWATLGPTLSHTAYSAAKYAVRGFSEALITDLRINAPHIKVSVVMPGHIGTSIVSNSHKVQVSQPSHDAGTQALIATQAQRFLEDAPTTAAEAARIILSGVKDERWRILVGEDAAKIDEMVRADPENAYEKGFFVQVSKEIGWPTEELEGGVGMSSAD